MRIFKLTIVFVSFKILHAQIPASLPQNNWELLFTKQNITWDWQGKLRYAKSYKNGFAFNIKDDFTSNLLLPGGDSENWRDEHKFNGFE